MPDARTTEQHEAVKQTVRDLLHGVHDPQKAAALIAAVVAHHAPELQAWARAQLHAKHRFVSLPLPYQNATSKPAEAQFQAIFGVQPVIAQKPLKQAVEPVLGGETAAFRVDPELGRLCVALHLAPAFRIWVIIRQLVREGSGSGWIERNHLVEALASYRVAITARHLRRVLVSGEDIFWNVTRKRVYMRSWAHVAASLTRSALLANIGRVDRNRPGARELYVPVTGSLDEWEARLYCAWFAYRNNPTISRSELGILFGRDKATFRHWEKTRLGGLLQVRRNYAQCPSYEAFYSHVPHYATEYVAWVRWKGRPKKVARIRWQLPNTYLAGTVRQHHRQGQAAKVRRLVNGVTETMPAAKRRGGLHRLYFDQAETLRKFVRTHPEAEARYVWRGENDLRDGIFEINESGFPLTHSRERAKPAEKLRPYRRRRKW